MGGRSCEAQMAVDIARNLDRRRRQMVHSQTNLLARVAVDAVRVDVPEV